MYGFDNFWLHTWRKLNSNVYRGAAFYLTFRGSISPLPFCILSSTSGPALIRWEGVVEVTPNSILRINGYWGNLLRNVLEPINQASWFSFSWASASGQAEILNAVILGRLRQSHNQNNNNKLFGFIDEADVEIKNSCKCPGRLANLLLIFMARG